MKLAFCIFKYYPFGGLGRDFIRIANTCQQRGHTVDIYTMAWQAEMPSNLHVTIVPSKGFTNTARCLSFSNNLKNIFKSKRYDVVVGFNRMPNLDLLYAADVCYEQDISERHGKIYRLGRRYKIYSAFERAVFGKTSKTKIMLVAEKLKAPFQKHYGTPDDRFILLPPNISKERIAPTNANEIREQLRSKHQLTNQQQLVLLIGSNFQLKGVDRAIVALANLPTKIRQQTLLWIVGQGKTKAFTKLAKKLGVEKEVKFIGLSDDVSKMLLAADLLIHPARREASGTVILEAVVAGLPVLTTDVCGFAPHIIKADAGSVIPSPFKQEALNKALFTMLTSEKRQEWHKNALHYAHTEDLYSSIEKAADVILANELKFGYTEPHRELLTQPHDGQLLYKVMDAENLIKSISGKYLHFNRVDSYIDFQGADTLDGKQLPQDEPGNKESRFTKAPNYSAANSYDLSRGRTYACCLSLENSDHIWQKYGNTGNKGKVCLVFEFGKLRSMLNEIFERSTLEYNKLQCKQVFSINYGIVEYVDWKKLKLNQTKLQTPIIYTYLKEKEDFYNDKELRISLAALEIYNFVMNDVSKVEFPKSIPFPFDFKTAIKNGTIKEILYSPDCDIDCLFSKLKDFGISKR